MTTFLKRRKKSKVALAYSLDSSSLELAPYDYCLFWKQMLNPTNKEQTEIAPKFMKAIIEKIISFENDTLKKKQEKLLTKSDSFLHTFLNLHCLRFLDAKSDPLSTATSHADLSSASFPASISQEELLDAIDMYSLALFHTFRYCLHFANIRLDASATNSLAVYLRKKRSKDTGKVDLMLGKDVTSSPSGRRYRSKRMDIVQRLNDEINFIDRSQKEVTADIVRKTSREYVIAASMFDQLSPTIDSSGGIIRKFVTNLDDFDWIFYRKKLKDRKQSNLFEEICQFIDKLPPLLSSGLDVELVMSSFCACLLFLKQLLTEGASYDPVLLHKKLLPRLQKFCMWPYPYGKMAQEMEYLVSSEIRAPGAFFRNVLFSQFPMLSAQGLKQKYLKDLMTASDGDGDTRKKRRLKIWPQMQRTVLLYTSADDQRGQSLAHLLTQYKNMYTSDEKSEKELSIEMQKRYLYVMFQQTLDIFDPLYVPSTAEEKKILVESGGWRRLKQKIPGRSCISVGNANNQVDLYVEDPLDMHKCGDDVIYDCYRRAISLMLKAEENDSWPIHGIRSWLSSHMAEILQQINNKFIAFPHTPYKKAFDKKVSLYDVGNRIIKMRKVAAQFSRKKSILFQNIDDQIHPVSPPSSGNKVENPPVSRSQRSELSFFLPLPEMNFEYGDHCNFTEMKYPMWNGDFNHIFRNCEMNEGGTKSQFSKLQKQGSEGDTNVARDRARSSSGDIDEYAFRTRLHSSFSGDSFGGTDSMPTSTEENSPSLYNGILRYPEAQHNKKTFGDFLKACDISMNPSFTPSNVSANGDLNIKGESIDDAIEALVDVHIRDNEDDTSNDVDQAYIMPNPPSQTRAQRSRSSTLQHSMSRSQNHITSKWRNNDYKRIASAGLLSEKNVVYSGTQNEIDFFRSSSMLRLCALGNDATVHRILCNFVVTMQEFHSQLSQLNVRVYLAPTSKRNNTLATYVACRDAWYRRHIYTPLSSPSFCFPYLNEQNVYRYSVDETIDWVRTQVVESKETSFENIGDSIWKKAEKHGIFSAILRLSMEMKRAPNQREIYDDEVVPGKTLKDVVHSICKVKLMELGHNVNERLSPNSTILDLMGDYIRFGKHVLPVCIYQCECWETVNTSGKGKSFIVPFCSSLEIGLGPISEQFRRIMAMKQRKQFQQQQPTKGSPKSGSGNSMFSASSKGSFSDLKMQHNFESMSSSDVMVSTEFLSTTGNKSNSSEFTANQVILSYKEVGSNGSLLETENVHSEDSFYKVSMSNVDNYADESDGGDLGSSPYSPHLKLFTNSAKSGHKIPTVLSTISKRVGSSGLLDQHDTDVLNQAMGEGGQSVLIHEATVKIKKQPRNLRTKTAIRPQKFSVLLDGELFGPFEKVTVKPMSLNGKQMFFPVATFTPF